MARYLPSPIALLILREYSRVLGLFTVTTITASSYGTYIMLYICNDRSFYVAILEDYSVAGVHIVVLVYSEQY